MIPILGTLRVMNGQGVARVEDRFDTDINDLWSAITDPERLARWYGVIGGVVMLLLTPLVKRMMAGVK